MENGKWQISELRWHYKDASFQIPDALQNGKLEMASGKFRNCVADYKASQGVKKLNICEAYPSFLPCKKEGGPPFNKLYIVIYIFRACLLRKELIKPGRWVVLANQLTPTITYNGKEMN